MNSEREVKILTGRPGRPKGVTILGGKAEAGVKIISSNTVEKKDATTHTPGTNEGTEAEAGQDE